MVPTAIVPLEDIPLTPTGKLDRTALPAPKFGAHGTGFRAPTTPAERVVVEAFAGALVATQVGVDDNFFDLGGSSLAAIRVVSEIQERLDCTVPLQALFLAPTPARLTARIGQAEPDTVDDALQVVVPLRAQGTRPPLFCVHAGIGLAWAYAALLPRLDGDRPVYGLQLPTISGGPMFESIEQLAHRYVEEIRAIQPEGPYHLLGWSLGGVIAHAVATELRGTDDDVATLTLIDSRLSRPDDAPPAQLPLDQLLYGLGVEADSCDDLTYERATELLNHTYGLGTGLTPDQLRRINEGYENSGRILHRFTPRVFDGDLLFFTATGPPDETGEGASAGDWRAMVDGEIHEYQVQCEHNDMLQPAPASQIGTILEDYISGRG